MDLTVLGHMKVPEPMYQVIVKPQLSKPGLPGPGIFDAFLLENSELYFLNQFPDIASLRENALAHVNLHLKSTGRPPVALSELTFLVQEPTALRNRSTKKSSHSG